MAPRCSDPDKDIPLPLLRGAGLLLGPRTDHGGYVGDQAPLLDLIHGFAQILGYSDVGDASGTDARRLMSAVATLMQMDEPTMSRNLAAMMQAMDEAKKPQYDAAQLDDTVTLYDDLAPVLVRLFRTPGLLDDVVAALGQPASADVPEIAAAMMNDAGFYYMNQSEFDSSKSNSVIVPNPHPVNHGAVDSDVDKNSDNQQNNRSVMQRTLHLVHDANNLTFCNKKNSQVSVLFFSFTYPNPCQLFRIDNLALFYILSVADESVKSNKDTFAWQVAYFPNALKDTGFVDFVFKLANLLGAGDLALEQITGIPGFGNYPSPQAAARMLFMDPNNPNRAAFLTQTIDSGACDPQRQGTLCCNQNHSWRDDHDGVLFALEKIKAKSGATFFTAFKPIVNAFAKHAECTSYDANGNCASKRNAAKILVDLLAVLHRHWATKDSRFFGLDYEPQNKKSGVVHYEPLIANLLTGTDLYPATTALSQVLGTRVVNDGSNLPVLTVVGNFLRWFFDPAAPRLAGGLGYRNGAKMSLRNDGAPAFRTTAMPFIQDVLPANLAGTVTPYYLIADAFKAKRARFGDDPAIATKWRGAISNLADQFLLASGGHFKNPRFQPVSLALIAMLQERLSAHGKAGDLGAWVGAGLVKDKRDSLAGPLFGTGVDLAARVAADDNARRGIQGLLGHLVNPTAASTFQSVVTTSADLFQLLLDDGDLVPVVRALAPAVDPDGPGGGAADALLGLVRRGRERDPQKVLLTVLGNLYQGDPSTGLYPLFRLTDSVAEIDRANAGQPGVHGTALTVTDYRALLQTTATFLSDHQRGMSRFLDILSTRNGD